MSDSDSTIPATDDFASRFLEYDEYSTEKPRDFLTNQPASPVSPKFRGRTEPKTIDIVASLFKRSTRGNRPKSYVALDQGLMEEDGEFEGTVSKGSDLHRVGDDQLSVQNSKPLTARQLSLQRKVSQGSSQLPEESELLSLESLARPKLKVGPTPEQLAARQRRIARRRETAIHKAQLEKQQTVEKLLKINVASIDSRKRGRGRGRNVRNPHRGIGHSLSGSTLLTETSSSQPDTPRIDDVDTTADIDTPLFSESLKDASDTNGEKLSSVTIENAPQYNRTALADRLRFTEDTLDPSPHYIRFISSIHLNPSKNICLHPNTSSLDTALQRLLTSSQKPVPPAATFCVMGCGRVRRYACSTTGHSICSLSCYKSNLDKHFSDVPVQSCT